MTREEAIKILKDCELNPCVPQDKEAANLAIKALEQQPCEDAVSRKAVVEYIKNSDAELGHDSENELVVEDILTMPSVKPVACIATVKFSKEDIQELVNEKMKEIAIERDRLKALPSAQPEIIRCKDCKKREYCRTTNTWAVAPSDDWFCADAERRTDE